MFIAYISAARCLVYAVMAYLLPQPKVITAVTVGGAAVYLLLGPDEDRIVLS